LSTKIARWSVAGTVLFLFGLSSAIRFQFAGQLFLTDLLTIPVMVFAVVPGWRRLPRRILGPLLGLMALWFASLVITDLYRATSLDNVERGWLKIFFFAGAILSVAALSQFRIGRLMAFSAGLAVAHIVEAAFFPSAYEISQPWKFGFGAPLATLAVILASLPVRGGLGVRAFPPVVMAAINLLAGFRSLFGILVGTIGTTCLAALAQRRSARRRVVTAWFAVAIVGVAVIGIWGATATYSALAGGGLLGRDAQAKYEAETEGKGGLLFVGRSDTFASIKAIGDSPILGHGSWAADRAYRMYQVLMLRQHGVNASGGAYTSDLIPSHSYILGAWVEAGLMGALFWAVMLVLTLNALIRLIYIGSPTTPFAAFALSSLLWNIPFSPFGAEVRFVVAGQLCVVIWVLTGVVPATLKHRTLATRLEVSKACGG
jgi:hypothetical protein